MTCTQTLPLLDAYTDHALPPWQTVRVRRHLAQCAACAAELAAIDRLTISVCAWRDASAPATLEHQIAAVLPRTAPDPMPPRDRRVLRRAALGLAGVAAAAGAGFWLLPGYPSQPTLAFADVERAMQQVQTVSWEHIDRPNKPSRTSTRHPASPSGDLRSVNWLRRNPPALATIYPDSGTKALWDQRSSFYLTKDRCEIRPPYKDTIKKSVEDELRSFTTLPQVKPTATLDGIVRTSVTNMRESHVVFEGQNLIRFDRDVKNRWFIKGSGRSPFETDHNTAHVSTWVDPATRRVTRIEARIFQDTHKGDEFTKYTEIEDHFQYDQIPPPDVFDWSPPKGVKATRF